MTVLWADDQQVVSQTISSITTQLGLQITYATSGESALRHLLERSYDLLILDLKMPPDVWGGLWLLQQLKDRRIKVPTIILSGEGTQAETIKGMRLGADDYVMKDQARVELVQRIQDLRAKYDPALLLRALITAGESDRFECKETLRWHVVQKGFDKIPENAAMKTVAGFLNSKGGTLIIGIKDDGTIVGLEPDRFESHDKALLFFDNLVKVWLSDVAAQYLAVSFVHLQEHDVMRIDCRPKTIPIYTRAMTGNDVDFLSAALLRR